MSAVVIVASADGPPKFPFEEKDVRGKLGLTEDELRALRKTHLAGSVHFVKFKKRIWLSAEGVDKLFMAAGQPIPEKTAAALQGLNAGDGEPKKTAAEVVTLLVVRTDLANRHLLLACAKEDDPDRPKKPLRVRVRVTVNFLRRMEIPAVLVDGYDDLYDMARPLPRKKGKW